jgi:hypothetical protein
MLDTPMFLSHYGVRNAEKEAKMALKRRFLQKSEQSFFWSAGHRLSHILLGAYPESPSYHKKNPCGIGFQLRN